MCQLFGEICDLAVAASPTSKKCNVNQVDRVSFGRGLITIGATLKSELAALVSATDACFSNRSPNILSSHSNVNVFK